MQIDYNLSKSLEQNITEFTGRLNTLENILIHGTFTYGCCGKPIEKPSLEVSPEAMCPYCLDVYRSKKEFQSESNYSYKYPHTARPQFSDSHEKNPILNESGEQLFHCSGEDKRMSLAELEEKYGEFEHIGKRRRVNFSNQAEFDIVANILEMVKEMPSGYNNGNSYVPRIELRTNKYFGPREMEYIKERDLTSEFTFIMSIKQIMINQILIFTTNQILTKIGNAGMALL